MLRLDTVLQKQLSAMRHHLMSTSDVLSGAVFTVTEDANTRAVLKNLVGEREIYNRPAYIWHRGDVETLWAYTLKVSDMALKILGDRYEPEDFRECCRLLPDDRGREMLRFLANAPLFALLSHHYDWVDELKSIKYFVPDEDESDRGFWRKIQEADLREAMEKKMPRRGSERSLGMFAAPDETLEAYAKSMKEGFAEFSERFKKERPALAKKLREADDETLEALGIAWLKERKASRQAIAKAMENCVRMILDADKEEGVKK